jgi:hypothetical protein
MIFVFGSKDMIAIVKVKFLDLHIDAKNYVEEFGHCL